MALSPQQQAQLASALQSKGYNPVDATNAARGPRADELAREYGVVANLASTGNPLQDVNKAIEDSFNKLNQEVITRYGQYKANNPFQIDEILAQKAGEAKEQVDPYYNETLSNYLLGVTRKIGRSKEDAQDLLTELSAQTESYEKGSRFKLNEALNRAQEGFADAGLFSSGGRYSTEGKLNYATGNDLADFLRGQAGREKQVTTGLGRTIEDVEAAKTQNVRDIERTRLTETKTLQSQLAKEAAQKYVTGFQQTLPTQLQANNNFDLLGSLGVYN